MVINWPRPEISENKFENFANVKWQYKHPVCDNANERTARISFISTWLPWSYDGQKTVRGFPHGIFANAICNLVSFRCNNKCNINSSQENEIYKTILYNSNIRLKFLDLRRATINIHDINAELQSEAVLNLYEYKSFVAENHAHLILNKIFISQVINLKRLLLVIKCNKNSNGKFHYSEEKMNKIKEKLDKIIVISEKWICYINILCIE